VELAVGLEHDLPAFIPGVAPVRCRQRRVAVVLEQLVQPEQPPLEPIVARHDVIARRDRLHQRVHSLVVHLVGEVACADPRGIFTQPVVRRLVGQDRVEDVGVRAGQVLQARGDGCGCASAQLAVARVEPVEDLVAGQLLAVQLVARRAVRLVEEAVPCAAAGHRLFVENLLLGLAQQVGPEQPHDFEPVAVASQRRVGQPRGRDLVRRVRQLQFEEDELLAELRAALGHALEQRAARRVLRVAGPVERGEAADAARALLQCLEPANHLSQLGRAESRNAAAILAVQRVGFRVRRVQVRVELRVVHARVQVAQVPGDFLSAGEGCRGHAILSPSHCRVAIQSPPKQMLFGQDSQDCFLLSCQSCESCQKGLSLLRILKEKPQRVCIPVGICPDRS